MDAAAWVGRKCEKAATDSSKQDACVLPAQEGMTGDVAVLCDPFLLDCF